jgi:amidase
MTSESTWEKVAEAKHAALAASIPQEYRVPSQQLPPESQLDVTSWPKESGWFSPEELEITDSTASQILQKVASKSWSSEMVTRAFCKRAAAAQQLVGQKTVCRRIPSDIIADQLSQRRIFRRSYRKRQSPR